MLANGVRWKVGNGKKIHVWKDAWIDGSGSGRVISHRLGFDE